MNQMLPIKHSEQINELAGALAKAQGEMGPAVFNRVNPHYKSRYADFTSCMDACREPLSKNGLAVSQLPNFTPDGKFVLTTLLLHSSGQWMACEFPMSTKNDNIQALGSAMSYAKRYSLCGMLGIVADEDVDDDGNSAVAAPAQQPNPKPAQNTQQAPAPAQPPKLVSAQQLAILKKLDAKLDAECKKKLYTWMSNSYQIDKLEDVLEANFTKVFSGFENAVKFMEQQKLEEQTVNG